MNLDNNSEYYGHWADSGALDDEWASGGIVKLLSFLRNETVEETVDYLTLMYLRDYVEGTPLPPLTLPVRRHRRPLDESKLEPYMFRHGYLERRGISEPVQRLMGVGYDRERKAVTMPWRLPSGELANIKYRRVDSKIFWYEKGGLPVRGLVYGIDAIYRKRLNYVVVCEAEIDAMSFMSCGVPAVAIGHGHVSTRQAEVLRQSPLETLYICTDNDGVGNRLRESLKGLLGGYMRIRNVYIPKPYKDANEALIAGKNLNVLVDKSRKISLDTKTLVRI